ncbi:MAG: class I tRNA ligase family protein, partial [bacterium JZ-2024 1]
DSGQIVEEIDGQSLKAFAGLDVSRARTEVVEDLKKNGRLISVEDYTHAVGHCQRCHTPVEPRISSQWFVTMRPLADAALRALRERSEPTFIPSQWTAVYERWLENILDWCISRQLWWGHRLPVWYCLECNASARALVHADSSPPTWILLRDLTSAQADSVDKISLSQDDEPVYVVSASRPPSCPKCGGARFIQDVDVLDTWFSSALWPFSVFGWPQETPDLARYYPTSILITGFDIIFFWVARMVMMGIYFTGKVPFREVYIHGLIRDIHGRKMSKSFGNTIDPMEVIREVGADALRFSFAYALSKGQDVRLSQDKLEGARRFLNKIWNASRLVHIANKNLSHPLLMPVEAPTDSTEWADRWILTELSVLLPRILQHYQNYDFREASHLLHEFAWSEFCDWYLEIIKERLNSGKSEISAGALQCALFVLQTLYHLLHPICPFQTEALFGQFAGDSESLLTDLPFPQFVYEDEEAVKTAETFKHLVLHIRDLKSDLGIVPSQMVPVYGSGIPRDWVPLVARLATISDIYDYNEIAPPAGLVDQIGDFKVCVVVNDRDGVRKRKTALEKELNERTAELDRIEIRLRNEKFLSGAPPAEVEKFRTLQERLRREIANLGERIQRLARLT